MTEPEEEIWNLMYSFSGEAEWKARKLLKWRLILQIFIDVEVMKYLWNFDLYLSIFWYSLHCYNLSTFQN